MSNIIHAFPRFRDCSLAALAACLFVGCGGGEQEPEGFHLSGKVTYDGKPVPAGKIYFTPDTSQGNKGLAGYADITNGQYDTTATGGKKHAGGAMTVRIEGFDTSAGTTVDAAGEEIRSMLFPTHEIKLELPKEDTTKDFDVPAGEQKAAPTGKDV